MPERGAKVVGAQFEALSRVLPIGPVVLRCKAQDIWGSGEYLKTGQERLAIDHKLCDAVCMCACMRGLCADYLCS